MTLHPMGPVRFSGLAASVRALFVQGPKHNVEVSASRVDAPVILSAGPDVKLSVPLVPHRCGAEAHPHPLVNDLQTAEGESDMPDSARLLFLQDLGRSIARLATTTSVRRASTLFPRHQLLPVQEARCSAYPLPAGLERVRPLQGSATGPETECRESVTGHCSACSAHHIGLSA